jgi:hypothetical protein
MSNGGPTGAATRVGGSAIPSDGYHHQQFVLRDPATQYQQSEYGYAFYFYLLFMG